MRSRRAPTRSRYALAAQPARVFRASEDPRPYVDGAGGPVRVPAAQPAAARWLSRGLGRRGGSEAPAEPQEGYGARLQLGSTDRYLFLYVEVDDPHFAPEPANPDLEKDRFDRVEVTLEQPDGALEILFLRHGAPGLIEAQTDGHRETMASSASRASRASRPYWLETAGGYHLEARVPLASWVRRLWVEARDAGGRKAGLRRRIRLQAADCSWRRPVLAICSATFIRSGTRVTVVDANGLKLGTAGSAGPRRPRGRCRAAPGIAAS